MKIKAKFKKERACKHSTRYIPVDDVGKGVTAVIYVNKIALNDLGDPATVTVTVETT